MRLFHRITGRGLIAFAHDIFMAGLSFAVAMSLRFVGSPEALSLDQLVEGTVALAGIAAIVFWMSGLYRGVWRYASMEDLMAITRAVSIAIAAFLLVMFVWTRMDDLPRSVPFITWFVLMALLGGPRFLYRFWKDRRIDLSRGRAPNQIPVLLVGASDGADQFIRWQRQSADNAYWIGGILSEHRERVGRTIRGINVSGTVAELETVFQAMKRESAAPRKLILTKEEITGAPLRDLLDRATALGATLSRMPRLTDLRDADGETFDIKPVVIEDLLGRPQTPLDREAMSRFVRNRRVMVTGAGGSIGAELVRQICAFDPADVLLLESNEYALYQIDREIADAFPNIPRNAIIADVRDRGRIDALFADQRPDVVFHAAALKHVPLVEANPAEGVRTNVGGTINVADACRAHGVTAMVLISTDKAVNPTNIMGATKRTAEMYCQALDRSEGACRYVTVRFGNVLGSTGSVVPLFQSQLDRGGPLTVTHPDMERYFMTIREAVELVLEASAVGTEDSTSEGRIFVLDMGDPIKIVDLARQMIRLSGKVPDEDVEIIFTGLRPGEKLFEEVLHGDETTLEANHPGLFLATPRTVAHDDLLPQITGLLAAAETADDPTVRAQLKSIVPEYQPTEDRTEA